MIATAVVHGLGLLAMGGALRAVYLNQVEVELNPLSWTDAAYASAVVLVAFLVTGLERVRHR